MAGLLAASSVGSDLIHDVAPSAASPARSMKFVP
jgi:hypothetical protein